MGYFRSIHEIFIFIFTGYTSTLFLDNYVPLFRGVNYNSASANWDSFYAQHQNKFFKDRHWLFTEFPELLGNKDTPISVLEIGCGAGNTVFPILQRARYSNGTAQRGVS